jgi:hypothetical protein
MGRDGTAYGSISSHSRARDIARHCASPDKFGNGAGNGFGLLQQHEVSRTRQVDEPDTLAELLAERVAIARRGRFIVEPLDRENRGCSGTPPIFERHASAGREVGEIHVKTDGSQRRGAARHR